MIKTDLDRLHNQILNSSTERGCGKSFTIMHQILVYDNIRLIRYEQTGHPKISRTFRN